ncbi:MAG: SDR family NAD(P)-dependent oxidoreductase [Kiritimatiellaeota bacterium]|nr:SDR family NAD(P)-dependent oxidoreductase [Kiritimatiellota bacterium]
MNSVVVITGSSKGIGRELAEIYHRNGFEVFGLARTSCDSGFHQIACDVASFERVSEAIAEIVRRAGKIDLLVNNAGYGISGAIENVSLADSRAITDVNFLGVFHCVKAALPHLRESRGRIINVASVAGLLPIPFQAFYAATKSAVYAFTLALRSEVAPFGVEVCCILPGDAQTAFTANRKKGDAEGVYADVVDRSVSVMEKDEQGGMSARFVAQKIYTVSQRKRLPLVNIVGFKYQVLYGLSCLFPMCAVNAVIRKMYRA